jgi:galactosyl transferase GMA12/MNN10 family
MVTASVNRKAGWNMLYRSFCLSCFVGASSNHLVSITKVVSVLAFVALLGGERFASLSENTKVWVPSPINYMERQCNVPSYPVVGTTSINETTQPTICMTTLTDSEAGGIVQRFVRWRNFDSLLEMTWPNKQKYCEKYGYKLFNESKSLDKSRPPSWSKIRAAQRLLREENCDWVLWLDADTVIMNSEKRIEDIIPIPETGIDLILTRQKGNSWNAGAWLIRNSSWSLEFLDHWWSMKEFVQPKGLAVSGDNDALKYYLTNMDPTEFSQHISVPDRCNFNSVAKWNTPEEAAALSAEDLKSPPFFGDNSSYHKGDFVAHVAGMLFYFHLFRSLTVSRVSHVSFYSTEGVDNKISTTMLLLQDAV